MDTRQQSFPQSKEDSAVNFNSKEVNSCRNATVEISPRRGNHLRSTGAGNKEKNIA